MFGDVSVITQLDLTIRDDWNIDKCNILFLASSDALFCISVRWLMASVTW